MPLGQTARGLEVAIADPTRLRGLDDLEILAVSNTDVLNIGPKLSTYGTSVGFSYNFV